MPICTDAVSDIGADKIFGKRIFRKAESKVLKNNTAPNTAEKLNKNPTSINKKG